MKKHRRTLGNQKGIDWGTFGFGLFSGSIISVWASDFIGGYPTIAIMFGVGILLTVWYLRKKEKENE